MRDFFQNRVQRKLITIKDEAKIINLIKSYFLKKDTYICNQTQAKPILIKELKKPLSLVIFSTHPLNDEIIIYAVLNKYVGIHVKLVNKINAELYEYKILFIGIAETNRTHVRKIVTGLENVYLTNIRTSILEIDASLFNVPTSVKLHFAQQESVLKQEYPDFLVSIKVLNKMNTIDSMLWKEKKMLYIHNTQKSQSYISPNNDFIDYPKLLFKNIDELIQESKYTGLHSVLYVPIIYVNEFLEGIPLGYIEVLSKKEDFLISEEMLLKMKVMSFEIIDNIRNTHTQIIKKKSQILNFSETGLKIQLMYEAAFKSLYQQKELVFDIVFKLQQPITLYSEIKYINIEENSTITLGVKIMGESTRASGDLKRYLALFTSFQ